LQDVKKVKKSPELYINWASYLGSKAIITSRFDKKKSKIMEWNISTDSEASFYPSPILKSKNILYELIESHQFSARVIPYNESPITAIFDLIGFSKSVKPYFKIC